MTGNDIGAMVTMWLLKGLTVGILGLWVFRWVIRWNHWRESARIAREDAEQSSLSRAAFLRELEEMKKQRAERRRR